MTAAPNRYLEEQPQTAGMGWLDRMVLLCAHLRGWQCVRTTTVTNWQTRATLHCRIAGQYEASDERLSGVNDGRCEIYNHVCKTISEQNADLSDESLRAFAPRTGSAAEITENPSKTA